MNMDRPEHFEAGDRFCDVVEHYVDKLEAENRRLYERLERYWKFQNELTVLMKADGHPTRPFAVVTAHSIEGLRQEIWPGGVFEL